MKALRVTGDTAKAYRRWLLAQAGRSTESILRDQQRTEARRLDVQPWTSTIDTIPIQEARP